MKILDITLPVSALTPVYPGDPATSFRRVADLAKGDPATVSAIAMSSHLGTHVDAPCHVVPGGQAVDEIPLDVLVGSAEVMALGNPTGVTAQDLELAGVPPGTQRLLLKTGRPGRRVRLAAGEQGDVFLREDAAQWMVDRGIKLVGIDALSVDPPGSRSLRAHRILLGADVVIVEGLELGSVSPGAYMLVCLPLKLAGCDGAPARVVLLRTTSLPTSFQGGE